VKEQIEIEVLIKHKFKFKVATSVNCLFCGGAFVWPALRFWRFLLIQFYDVMSSRRRRLARQALKAASAEGGKR
jgi:hypothetical protein